MFGFSKKLLYQNFPGVDPATSPRRDVVGESFHQDNLEEMAQWPFADDEYAWVSLRAEPRNPHDSSAIRVDWIKPDGSGWLTLGHIARAETARWHPVLASAPRGVTWAWPAELIGGQPGKSYGVVFYG